MDRTNHRGILVLGAFFGGFLAPALAAAAGETKFEAALRSGYGIPLGKATADATADMSEATAGQIPIWLDLGARIKERVFLGASFSYGFGFLGSEYSEACQQQAAGTEDLRITCTSTDVRLGATALYHFGPQSEIHDDRDDGTGRGVFGRRGNGRRRPRRNGRL